MRTLITGIISNENWEIIVLHLKAACLKSLQESLGRATLKDTMHASHRCEES